MFDAVLFLGGAVLFLLAVVFFVVLWQQRIELEERESTIEQMETQIREQRVDLEILERELTVWEDGLTQEQRMLEEAREELRMLTAAKRPDRSRGPVRGSPNPYVQPSVATETSKGQEGVDKGTRYRAKNIKFRREEDQGKDRDF